MSKELQQLQAAIAGLEAQRALLSDAVLQAALGPLRERLAALQDTPAPAARPQALKQASILCLDVVGSTALSLRLDPEAVSAVIDHALQRATAIVQAHRGRVLQYAGDNLLAAFGADDAAEDDAERAVHCGLALQALGRTLGEEVLAAHGHAGLGLRVGVHTGRVLIVGGGGDDEGFLRGPAVDGAQQLEQAAPAGGLCISHDTWLLVRGVFDVQALPPLALQGADAPVASWLVLGAKPRAFRVPSRGIEGLLPPMVGRQAELAQLAGLLDDVAGRRLPRAATVIGEPGLGKSRLMHELQAALETHAQRFWLLLGRAHPGSRLQPYGMLRDLLAWRLQIADGDSGEQARAKLVDGLLPWLGDDAEAHAHRIGQIIGFDFATSVHVRGIEPALLRTLAFDALHRYLRGLTAQDGAAALLLEDLHWADDGSLDFFARLMAADDAGAMLVVASARPELLERRPDWGASSARHPRITLQALDAAQGQALAQALLARLARDGADRAGADTLQALLVARAEGNPFYMEELVRMLLDDGVIVADAGTWRVLPERLRGARLPTTLVGVLQARLDGLPAAERRALQQASIVGPVFWDQALAALDPPSSAALPALQRRALVHRRERSSFDDTAEEAFHHHLLQQVTYDTVLKPMRLAGHAAAAQWLVDRVGDRHAEYLAITADHCERAGDHARALAYFERAALDAQGRFANTAALDCVDRALRSPAATDARGRERLYRLQSAVADLTGQRTLQQAALDARAAIAEALDDDWLRADLLVARALLASRRSDEQQSQALAQQAAAVAERAGHSEAHAMALGQIAWAHFARGELGAASQGAQQAIALAGAARRAGDTPALQQLAVKLLNLRAIFQKSAGELTEALATLAEAQGLAQALGMARSEANLQSTMAAVAMATGDFALAAARSLDAARLADRIGSVDSAATARYNAASCHFELGQAALAGPLLDQAEADALRCEYRDLQGRCLLLRGRMAAATGDDEAAQRFLDRAAERFEAVGLAPFRCQVRAELALLHLGRQRLPQALAEAEQITAALAAGVSLDGTDDVLRPLLACHRVWAAAGDARAAAAIEDAHAALQALAARVGDAALRRRVLQDIPVHREVAAAWQARQAAAGAAR